MWYVDSLGLTFCLENILFNVITHIQLVIVTSEQSEIE